MSSLVPTSVLSSVSTMGVILVSMAVIALIEIAIPLHARGPSHRAHIGPNVVLTFLTFATNAFFNVALLTVLIWQDANGVGLMHVFALPPVVTGTIVLVTLDFSFYVAHVAMHKIPVFWRFHSVHHSDPAVDVTTTIRQHPGEGVIRYAFMAAFACALGASPVVFGVYRIWSALNGLIEHANIRVPVWFDRVCSLVTTWPNMHKIHHSRTVQETDTNYGNIFSLFDRIFRTFTPSHRGVNIVYGLDGYDAPATQTTTGLLAVPFRWTGATAAVAAPQLS